MAPVESFVNDPDPPPQATKQPARVVQLSRKLMAFAPAAVSGNKSKTARPQKRPAPVLPPEAKRTGERPLELNAYAASRAKGGATHYMDLVRSLGELKVLGDKGNKQLLTQVLPRLAQHELPPAALVPQILQLPAGSDDRRLLRFVYYLVQLVLGPGSAGTPAPAAGEAVPAILSLPGDIANRAWEAVLVPDSPAVVVGLQLRTLSAATRAAEGGRMDRLLAEAVQRNLERAEAVVGTAQAGNKAQQREALEAWELHWGCLLAARNGLPDKPLGKLALRSSVGIISPCAGGARQALALLTHAMKQNAAAVFKEDKDLAGWMTGAVTAYEAGPAGGPGKKAERRHTLRDRWVRLELCRLCAAAVYADWTSTQGFVRGIGAPFWRLLCLLATQEAEDLVALEAISCLFGSARGPKEEARGPKLRARAWLMVSSEEGLAADVASRLAKALQPGGSEPLRCTACAAAGAVLEAASRVTGRGAGKGKEAAQMDAMVAQVTAAVRGAVFGGAPAVSCAALEALLWTHAAGSTAAISPAAVARCISAGRWPRDLLQALLERVFKVLRAAPAAVRPLLQLAGAAAAAGAACVEPDQLLELWTAAMRVPDGKAAALDAALSVLASPTPNRRPRSGGAAELGAAAGEDAGRLLLLRDAAWWLGEHANLAAGEFAGSLPPREERNENEAPQAEATPLEAAALEAFRNPQMAAVVSHLQHAALTLPPGPRTAAVQALAKVAVRSEEPYRLQCYSVLASLAAASSASEPDAHGVSCAVQPVLRILDMLYSSRLVLERLAQTYGRQPRHWPPSTVAQLRARNTLLEQRIQRVVCSLSGASYFLLGPLSRDLLTSGVESLLVEPLPKLQTVLSVASSEAPLSPLAVTTARHSRNNSIRSETGTPLFGGADPLAALTDNLGQHLAREAFKKRAPAPWELAPAPIPEEESAASEHAGFEDEPAPPPPRQLQERGLVVHAFRAEMSDELSVSNGEEVDVEAELDGWLDCVNRYGVRGLVPASYVRILREGEAAPDLTSQLFGGYGASQHRREQSVDLLNQPDMLAALLGSPPEEDSWGGAPAAFHSRRLSTLQAAYDSPEPPPAAADVDGDMAIPEPQPEPEPQEADDNPFDRDEEEEGGEEAAPPAAPLAPDNPFEDEEEQQEDVQLPPPQPLPVRAPPSVGSADGQPLSARVELASEGSAGLPPGSPAPGASSQPLSRRHSRQASREFWQEGGLSRQASAVEQARHMRQPSADSAGVWPSRQSSVSDVQLTAIRATVLYEFVAETEDELSVAPGEAIVIQAEVDGWYQVLRPTDGRRGLIPASYVAAAP